MNLLARTRFEMNPLKSAESNQRRTLHGRELEIDLHNLISRDFACISHAHIGTYWLTRCHRLHRDAEVAVLEGRIAESVAKRIERLVVEIAVGPVGHAVVLEVWQLVDAGVERNRQPARGIIL